MYSFWYRVHAQLIVCLSTLQAIFRDCERIKNRCQPTCLWHGYHDCLRLTHTRWSTTWSNLLYCADEARGYVEPLSVSWSHYSLFRGRLTLQSVAVASMTRIRQRKHSEFLRLFLALMPYSATYAQFVNTLYFSLFVITHTQSV